MPKGRAYLPYGLTKAERKSPALRGKLVSCIRQVEKTMCPPKAKVRGRYRYELCRGNPVSICRASLKRRLK